jgi:ArsR family metal-binding transcriptional regulator
MSLMDKVKENFDKAKDGVSEFAETAKVKHEISKLNDRKAVLIGEIGHQVYTLYGQGHIVAEVEAQCREIQTIEEEIKHKGEEIVRINAA